VLMLTAYPSAGGPIPKLTPLVVEGLSRTGDEVAVCGWSAHTAGRESLAAKIVGRSGDLVRVFRRIRGWRPDVIYVATAHTWPSLLRDIPLALLVGRQGPPLVLHMHGSSCERLGQPGEAAFTAASRWLADRAACVMLLSTEEERTWRRFCPRGRFEVVDNPFIPTHRGARPAGGDSSGTVLCVARLATDKGVLDLLEAFALTHAQRPCRLVYAGEGPLRGELTKRAEALGVRDAVTFLGYVTGDDLDAAYDRADVFVLPSYKEGFPLSVMEAMSHGLPIVTTPIRGCADHLVPDEHALFVPAGRPHELARAMLRLLEDPALRERLSTANRAKVRAFAPEAVLPRYAAILLEAARSRRPDTTRRAR